MPGTCGCQKAQDEAGLFSFNLGIVTCFCLSSGSSRASPRLCLQGRQEAAAGAWEQHHSISREIKRPLEKLEENSISFPLEMGILDSWVTPARLSWGWARLCMPFSVLGWAGELWLSEWELRGQEGGLGWAGSQESSRNPGCCCSLRPDLPAPDSQSSAGCVPILGLEQGRCLCLQQLGNRRRWGRAGRTGLLPALALTYEPARQTPPAPAPRSWLCSAPRCWHGALSPAQPRSRPMDGKTSPVSAGGSRLRGSVDSLPSGFGGGSGFSLLLSGVFLHSSRREKELPEELLPPAPLGTRRRAASSIPGAGRGSRFATPEL